MGVGSRAKLSLRLRGSGKGYDGSDVALERQQRHRNEHHYNRRLEDANVDYWRKRAGWADDDESMKSYNQGVYNTYYMGGDDAAYDSMVGSGGNSRSSSSGRGSRVLDHIGWILGLASTVVFLVLLVKCCSSAPSTSSRKRTSSVKSRDSSRSIRDKHGERRSRSRSRAASGRSRSKSRTRSKSRRREKDGDYRLMDEEEEADNKSRRSTRSASSKKSSRSRSRSKVRSRSKARSKSRSSRKSRGGGEAGSGGGSEEDKGDKGDKKKDSSKEQKMLV